MQHPLRGLRNAKRVHTDHLLCPTMSACTRLRCPIREWDFSVGPYDTRGVFQRQNCLLIFRV